jgi:hypothetical protein
MWGYGLDRAGSGFQDFMTSRSILLKMRNVSDKSCRGNQNTRFVIGNCSSEIVLFYQIMWKNILVPGGSQMTTWRMPIACWIPKATHTHTQRICKAYCFCTAKMAARTRLNVTLYVHCTFPYIINTVG